MSTVEPAIQDALSTHFRNLRPFVDGVDVESERNDLITSLSLCSVVQDVLQVTSNNALEVQFERDGILRQGRYRLEPGELAKLGTVTYE